MKSKERVKKSAEVFTPRTLIREMLDMLPNHVWFNPNKTWFEPSAGDGNFLVEIKARLLQAGHQEKHILENMLFSVELIDDNHWTLQHRLGYLIDGNPNPELNLDHFAISKIHPLTQDLNDKNPYHEKLGLERDEVLHHRNHVCWSGLEYDMSFGRTGNEFANILSELDERDLGEWPETDTPDIGERYVVEKMLGPQEFIPKSIKKPKIKALQEKQSKQPKIEKPKEQPIKLAGNGGWSINPKFYGQGKIIRSFYEGKWWIAKHDDIIDEVNQSLKEKGKPTLFENEKYLKNGFHSSNGLRAKDKYWTEE